MTRRKTWRPMKRLDKPPAMSMKQMAAIAVAHPDQTGGDPEAFVRAYLEKAGRAEHWVNLDYHAMVLRPEAEAGEFAITWVSIKRHDRKAIRDWRVFQAIKNDVLGPEVEAVELFPAESRLADSVNQYHLWALPEGQSFPFGFESRFVSEIVGEGTNTKQRPFMEIKE